MCVPCTHQDDVGQAYRKRYDPRFALQASDGKTEKSKKEACLVQAGFRDFFAMALPNTGTLATAYLESETLFGMLKVASRSEAGLGLLKK